LTAVIKDKGGQHGLILVLNAGSSSLKFALYSRSSRLPMVLRGEVADLDTTPGLIAFDADGRQVAGQRWPTGDATSFAQVLDAVLALSDNVPGHQGLCAVGHRIVHGGPDHIAPARMTPALLAALDDLVPLAPLHLPHNLRPIAMLTATRTELTQVVCFDTAFHHTMPEAARSFALPRRISQAGVRRYGFHGLSYEYIAGYLATELPDLARGRVIVAHLGAGASLCALKNGISIATTMGLSVLDGLMMATRSGSLDPGVILYLMRQGHSTTDIEDILYHQSGLLGVSGLSGDIRDLLASEDPHAREAIDLFTYRIAIEVGAMTSALGGVDGLVFTAGIGQHAPAIRAGVCARLAWLGIRLDAQANDRNAFGISASGSLVDVHVIATNEERMIARHVQTLTENANG